MILCLFSRGPLRIYYILNIIICSIKHIQWYVYLVCYIHVYIAGEYYGPGFWTPIRICIYMHINNIISIPGENFIFYFINNIYDMIYIKCSLTHILYKFLLLPFINISNQKWFIKFSKNYLVFKRLFLCLWFRVRRKRYSFIKL